MTILTERLQSLSPEQRILFELHLRQKKLKIPVLEIPRVPRGKGLPLSFAQQRLWLLQQLSPESPLYNTYLPMRLRGQLNIEALKQSVREVLRRHEVLHTTFPVENGQPVQQPDAEIEIEFRIADLRHVSEADRESQAHEILRGEVRGPFHLQCEPAVRILLALLAADDQILLVTMHHVVSDRWSIDVMARELGEIYEANARHRAPRLTELSIQYADYACWQRERMKGDLLQEHLSYWKRQLQGLSPLELPVDWRNPATPSSDGSREYMKLDGALVEKLAQTGQSRGATLFMTMLALFEVLLFRYTGTSDFAIGTPVTDRSNPQTKELIGCFVNTLILRTSLEGNPSFLGLLERVKQTCLDAYTWQDLPFERVVEELQPHRSVNSSPLFRTLFTLNDVHEPLGGRNLLESTLLESGLQLCPFEIDNGAVAADLVLRIERLRTETVCALEYRTQLFRPATMARMLEHFRKLLDEFMADPSQRIADVPLLNEAERHNVLTDWNACQIEWKDKSSIVSRIAEQARKAPDAPAVVGPDKVFSYGELNRKANQWALALRKFGVTKETVVAVWLPRSPEMVAVLLAIWKAGGAYLPVGEVPPSRVSWMMSNAGSSVLITDDEHAELIAEWQGTTLTVENLESDSVPQSETELEIAIDPESLAYVIYTSGSTGQPKGVMIQHGGLLNLLEWHVREYSVNSDDRASHLAGLGFDGAVWELWPYLICGASLHLVDEETRLSPLRLTRWLKEKHISISFVPTPLAEAMMKEPWPADGSLRLLLTGGDKLHHIPSLPADLILINHYGPTESTVVATSGAVLRDSQEAPTIGRPIANSEAYVLDAGMEPVPVGVMGELYVGGAGLARGYAGRPEMTAERFVSHPHSERAGARLYRTGDWARYRENGELEFGGRKDGQVKIRGFRVELGEIEAALREHEAVKEAVAVVRGLEGDEQEKRIVAYVVAKEAGGVSGRELREHVRGKLPEYMTPSGWALVEELPLTANGKVDREALKRYEEQRDGEEEEYVEARTEVERKLAKLWQELLRLERVSIHANFFDLGGHSLLAAQMASRFGDMFSVDLPLRSVFENATIARLANLLSEASSAPAIQKILPLVSLSRSATAVLSFAQQRLWVVANLEPESSLYNIPFAIRMQGQLNKDVLQESLRAILRRHQVLRAIFPERDGQPFQEITNFELDLPSMDVSLLEPSAKQKTIEELMQQEAQRPFDLRRGPLFRAMLLEVDHGTEHILLVTMHHIVSDGWSVGILLKEFAAAYRALCEGAAPNLADLPIQYADYAQWQREWLQADVLQEHLDYWKNQLEDLPVLNLPLDYSRPEISSYHGESIAFSLPSATKEKLQTLIQEEGLSQFMLVVAAFQLLLSRYCQQQDVVVGADVACRDRAETEGLVGFFVNQLVLRSRVEMTDSFRQLLRQVKETTLGAYTYQSLPFERLVEEHAPARELNRHPLFQCKIAMQYRLGERLKLPGLHVDALESKSQMIKTDIRLVMNESPTLSCGRLEYAVDLFAYETMQRWVEHWLVLLERIASAPDLPLSEITLLTATEREWLAERNATGVEIPAESVCEQFERQAVIRPNAIAAVFEKEKLTYEELDAKANQLAHYLRSLGMRPESFATIYMERSLEMVVALLAVWKAGGAYIPLDKNLPSERIQGMLDETEPVIILTKRHLLANLRNTTTKTICLDAEWKEISEFPVTKPQCKSEPENVAYVLYTSGSTGRPKGVMISHASLANYTAAIIERAEFKSGFSYAMVQPLTVDSCVTVLFPPLCVGGVLHVMSEEVTMDGRAMVQYFDRHAIDCLKIAPTHLAALHAAWPDKWVMPRHRLVIGGEASNYEWISTLAKQNPDCVILNHYGPTETTVGVLTCRITGEPQPNLKATPLEKALANTEAHVLDEYWQPVPISVPGELYIGGRNVGRGYLKQPSLTAERFIPDPFATVPGARLYRTGDLVRLSPAGKFEYLGRIDDQVKIRGFRVELGEVESVLLRHSSVFEAVVISRESATGDTQLAAYIVLQQNAVFSQPALREFLSRYLPPHMIPDAFVVLKEMPRLPHGKLNRKALPAPVFKTDNEDGYTPPRSPAEEVLAAIWQKILGREQVGIHDNFFEIGGNSLLAIQVLSQVRQIFKTELQFRTLFTTRTLAELAHAVEEARQKAHGIARPPMIPVPRNESLPLSFAQQRLWFIQSLDPDNAAYLVPVIVRLTGELNIGALQKSFERLIQRHEVLRTTFPLKDHAPVQSIATGTILPLTVRDLRTLEGQDRERALRDCIATAGREPFDLAAGPLLRVQVLQLSAADSVLVLVLHHIISDGWSAGILIQELAALYESFVSNCEASLPPLPIQYADFSVWQAGWLQGEELDRLLAYWSRQLANSSSLRFPADYQVERGQPAQSGHCSRDLDRALSLKLKSLARQEGATDFMLLLAAFAAVLVRHTSQHDMNIGTPVAGRTHAELEPLLGFFVNTLVLRIKADGNPDFVELLRRVREVTIEAYEHQDLPFEKLVEKLQPAREAAHAPLFDVMFVLQNAPRKMLRVADLEMSQMEAEPTAGKFNLLLVMRDTEDGFKAGLEYNASRFAASTMERFLNHFERFLRTFADASGERLMEARLLNGAEQRQALREWNNTAVAYPSLPVHRIFEAHAQRCPGSVALEVDQQRISYAELNGKANQLAHHLSKIGVGPEHRVAICLQRSADLVISLLATLKAGGVYVPLEANYPRERLAFMLENSAATVLITEHSLLERLPEPRIQVVHLDADWPMVSHHGDRNLALNVWPEQLAYIMYTSGSTGIPKGVEVTHRNIVRLTQENSFAAMTAEEVFFQFAPVSFDASTFEIWGALLNGAKLVICPVQDPSLSELGEILQRHQVTTLWLTAGLFRLMVDEQLHSLSGLHQLLAGGDALSVPHVERVIENLSCRLINGYGPTENTTFSCCHTLSPRERLGSSVPIGRPIANSEAYVLDERIEPVPVGVMGELYVGGQGLARGYAGRPDMTAERFVPHPHSERAGARLYRTGDWARYRENGELEFGGRKDGQVKIRGFRVELGEIEAALREHEAVKEAVAVVRGLEGEEQEKRIVAYVVAKEAGGVSGRELREHVRGKLPEYMTPSGWALVEELPLTANGKVDREALRRYEEERDGEEAEYVEARTEVERKVAKLWQELLRLERVSIHANFFDLGGHSLLATQIVSRLQQAFQVRIPLRMMFDSPTIAELAEDIEVLLWMAESGEALPPRAMKMEAGLSS